MDDPETRGRPASDPFVLITSGGTRYLVRRGYEPWLTALFRPAPESIVARTGSGRAAHPVIELPGGARVVVRAFRRGGLLRRINRDRYFVPHRAFRELRVTEAARAGGLAVPFVVAAAERPRPPGYTAMIATLWIDGAVPLPDLLSTADPSRRADLLRHVGAAVRRLHEAAIVHPDLNLGNVLVVSTAGSPEPAVVLVDFDRARAVARPLSRPARARMLRRLARSASRLAMPFTPADRDALRAGYGDAWPIDRARG